MGMMLNRRRVMRCSKSILPDGYKLLQYVSNNNNAFLKLNFNANNTTILETELYNFVVDAPYMAGTRTSQSNGGYFAIGVIGEKMYFTVNIHGNAKIILLDSNLYASVKVGNGVFQVGETTMTYTTYSFASSNPFTLFRGCNNLNGDAIGNLYYIGGIGHTKIRHSGEVFCDLYPCENRDGIAGFYDISNSVFLGSSNATPFIAGPEI